MWWVTKLLEPTSDYVTDTFINVPNLFEIEYDCFYHLQC